MLRFMLLLLMPMVANAGDRLSYLTVDQDNVHTAVSTITCKIQASRLPKGRTYSGVVNFQWQPVSGSGFSTSVAFEVSPTTPTYTEGSPGGPTITAKMVDTTYSTRVVATLLTSATLTPDDIVTCDGHIDYGPSSAPLGALYTADMRYVDRTGL